MLNAIISKIILHFQQKKKDLRITDKYKSTFKYRQFRFNDQAAI